MPIPFCSFLLAISSLLLASGSTFLFIGLKCFGVTKNYSDAIAVGTVLLGAGLFLILFVFFTMLGEIRDRLPKPPKKQPSAG
jgi:hypothetical protein